jgi:hypothetical protein
MKILAAYSEGFSKSRRLPKIIVLLWAISLVGSLFVVAPLERNIGAVLDGYLVSELLYEGEDAVAYADILRAVLPTLSLFSFSFLLVGAIVFLLNTFITAGLYRVLAGNWKKRYKTGTLLKGADRGFPSFLFISVVAGIVISLLIVILLLLPQLVVWLTGTGGRLPDFIFYSGLLILFLTAPIVMLTADYARVIITSDKWAGPYRAMVDGFRLVRSDLMKNWLIMAVFLAVSIILFYVAMRIAPDSNALSGIGIMILLILSQLLTLLNIWLKVVRYGTITALYENGH